MRGLGIELVESAAFEGWLDGTHEEELTARFSPEELEYCRPKARAAEHLAARQAAKVAALKALGLDEGREGWLSCLEVRRAASGQPTLIVKEPLQSQLIEHGPLKFFLSMSHSGGYAVAMVVVEGEGG